MLLYIYIKQQLNFYWGRGVFKGEVIECYWYCGSAAENGLAREISRRYFKHSVQFMCSCFRSQERTYPLPESQKESLLVLGVQESNSLLTS